MADSRITGALGGAGQGAAAGAAFGPWGAVIGGGIGAVAGFLGGGGEDEAEALAELQAKIIKNTSRENIRVMTRQMGQEVGMARAAQGASNVQFSGSGQRFINEMATEWRRNMAWEKDKARMEARAALKGGAIAASKIEAQGISNLMSGVSSAASSGLLGSYTKSGGYEWDPWG